LKARKGKSKQKIGR